MGHRVGIDIGGTFTDVVLLRDDGRFHVYKEDSTPDQPLLAITRGLSRHGRGSRNHGRRTAA